MFHVKPCNCASDVHKTSRLFKLFTYVASQLHIMVSQADDELKVVQWSFSRRIMYILPLAILTYLLYKLWTYHLYVLILFY